MVAEFEHSSTTVIASVVNTQVIIIMLLIGASLSEPHIVVLSRMSVRPCVQLVSVT